MKKKPYISAPCRLAATTVLLLGACSADPSPDDASETRPSGTPTSAQPSSPVASEEQSGEPTYVPDAGEVFKLPEGKGWATLREGRYAAWGMSKSLRYEVDVPDGWRALSGTYINAPEEKKGIFLVARTPKDNTRLPVHPCRDHSLRLVGPTVDDLATAMAAQPVWRVSPPRPVMLAGVPAMYLEVELPARVDPADCLDEHVSEYEAGRDGLWTTQSYKGRWWVLEVDGERFVVMARCYDTCTEDDLDIMSAMAESIRFLARPKAKAG
jgi:hypothetical protein